MLKTAKNLLTLVPDRGEPVWIIDGGCHAGVFSNQVLREFPHCRILAFEPDPDSWAKATLNVVAPDQFELVKAALGRERCRSEFFRGPFPATNSLLPRPDNELRPYYPEDAVLKGGSFVDVLTLDDECEKRGIKKLDLVKLDLQGGELAALSGAKDLLGSGSISVIIVEAVFVKKYQGQPLLWEVWRYLDSQGYSLYSLTDVKLGLYRSAKASLRDGQWNQCNAIFISKTIRQSLDGQEGVIAAFTSRSPR